MPALYAHDRFGEKVSEKSDGELKNIIFKYYNQYEVGLQGPDILFFYRPYHGNDVAKYGSHLHAVSALPFFEHAAKVVKPLWKRQRAVCLSSGIHLSLYTG